jgi:hypothetical protein
MEKKSTVQIKYEDQEVKANPITRMRDVFGLFRSIDGAPTGTPTRFADQIVIDTTNARLYVYDSFSGTWKYVGLT